MTPDAVKYEITLENERQLRMRTWRLGGGDLKFDDAYAREARWSDVAITPTSRLIVWMLRRSSRRQGLALAVLLVPAYSVVAYTLWHWTPSSAEVAPLAVVGVAFTTWNAIKLAIAGAFCTVAMIRSTVVRA